jgi:flagellar biosynthetic protein FlhB
VAEKSDDSQDEQQERLLEPTQRKLDKAREEGQFPQARDLTTFLVVIVFVVTGLVASSSLFSSLVSVTRQALTFAEPSDLHSAIGHWASSATEQLGFPITLVLAAVAIAGFISPLALVKFQPKFALKFKTDKLSLIKGLKRIFSTTTLLELGKTIIKVIVIFSVGVTFVYIKFPSIIGLPQATDISALAYSISTIGLAIAILLLPLALVALVDTALQWYNFRKKMRMSYEELKKELKETDGSPEVRARQKFRQRQLATMRMMTALEKADVVIVNPEHFAVALRYDINSMAAPIVIAKGQDELALRMQAIAKERNLPIARIPPLARYIYRKVKLGEIIPESIFDAVAQVIAWAYKRRETTNDLPVPSLENIDSLDSDL